MSAAPSRKSGSAHDGPAPSESAARPTALPDPDSHATLSADALCVAIGAVVLSRIEIEHYLDRLHAMYPSRLPSLEPLRGDAVRDRAARLLKRVSRSERNRACVRDLEFWLAACLRFLDTAPALVTPQALIQPDAPRLERAASDGRWAATNLKRLCQWLEREREARRAAD